MKVRVDIDTIPDDQAVEIPGLGLCVNHQEKEVDEQQVAMYNDQRPPDAAFPEDGFLHVVIKDYSSEEEVEAEAESDDEETAEIESNLDEVPIPDDLDEEDQS